MKMPSEAIKFIENNLSKYKDFTSLRNDVLLLLDYEMEEDIVFENLSFCLIPYAFDHFKNLKCKDKSKSGCESCAYFKFCNGYSKDFKRFISPVKDIPKEIVIEVTDKCNHNCSFCFNSLVYGIQKRNERKDLSTGALKKIIDQIALSGVKIIRFSGGEPFLRKDICELISYAKSQNLQVWLNSNATSLNDKDIHFINDNIDNILIPLNGYDDKSDSFITKLPDSFSKKISVLKKLENVKIKRIGVVLIKDNIDNLEKFYEILKQFEMTFLEFYRPITKTQEKELLKTAIDKIYSLNLKHKKNVKIANALPFCFYKPDVSKKICLGGIFDDGNSRFVIGSSGIAKPSYYLSKNIGSSNSSILDIWNNPYMKSLRELGNLPKLCINCEHKLTCRGGSRALREILKLEKDPLI
jgi:MoaA/NifB/PqqE/SkfB family radical SAM enzyme